MQSRTSTELPVAVPIDVPGCGSIHKREQAERAPHTPPLSPLQIGWLMKKLLEEKETLTQIVNVACPPTCTVSPIYKPKFSLKNPAKNRDYCRAMIHK